MCRSANDVHLFIRFVRNLSCRVCNVEMSALFALIVILYLVLPSMCFSDIGAEWNPTGDPIGGGPGYSDSVRHQDADYYVCTKTELLYALEDASCIRIGMTFLSPFLERMGTMFVLLVFD